MGGPAARAHCTTTECSLYTCSRGTCGVCSWTMLNSRSCGTSVRPSEPGAPQPRARWRDTFAPPALLTSLPSSTHSTSPPIPIHPHLPHIYNMFAARQVSQSVVGAVQRRAFSASASNVSELNSQQNKTIRSNGDRPSIEPLQAHPLTLMLPCSSPRLPSSVPVAESASLCLSSSSSTRVSPTSPSSTFAVPPALPLMSATSTPRALYVATRYQQD